MDCRNKSGNDRRRKQPRARGATSPMPHTQPPYRHARTRSGHPSGACLKSGAMDCRNKSGNDERRKQPRARGATSSLPTTHTFIPTQALQPSCPDLFRASIRRTPQIQSQWITGTSPAMTEEGSGLAPEGQPHPCPPPTPSPTPHYSTPPPTVMPGLVPGIHPAHASNPEPMDCRNNPRQHPPTPCPVSRPVFPMTCCG